MAGDWIAMRTDLANDPAVIRIAELCGISRPHAVGCLHAVWSWFDQQTQDGDAPSVTETLTDSLTGVTGFARAMADDLVRWLEIRPGGGLRIPDFERYMSQSAKRRLLTARRNAAYRRRHRDAATVSDASPTEQNRTYKDTQPPNPLSPQTGTGGTPLKASKSRKERKAEREARLLAETVERLRGKLPSDEERR